MNSIAPLALAFALAAALAGCGAEPPSSAPASTTPSAEATSPVEPPSTETPSGGTDMSVEPASLQSCDPPDVVTLQWDFRDSHPQATEVEVWVGTDAEPVLFASGGATGSATTGAWAYPGLVFRARSVPDGQEIGKVAITGPECPSG